MTSFLNALFLIVSFCCSTLFAGIEQYFKKAEGKLENHHRMRGIDFIYCINLDQRPEKFESCVKQLTPFGIHPYRFSAVNGWEFSFDTVNDLGVKFEPGMCGGFWGTSYFPEDNGLPHHEIIEHYGQTYYGHCMAWGAIGCILSHLSVLQDAYDSGYETIWVLEDDIEVIRDPHLISDLIEIMDQRLKQADGWDVLFTDKDSKNRLGQYVLCSTAARRPNFFPNPRIFKYRKNHKQEFRQIGARYGTYSMIIRRSGMKKILDFFKTYKLFLPYDMDLPQTPGIRLFTVREDIVSTQIDAASDNGGANYFVN